MRRIILVAHNVRSAHNVGSLLRTAEGLGVEKVILSGYTPYPNITNDPRLPHLAHKIHRQISKTSLGAEEMVALEAVEDIQTALDRLHANGFILGALEQAPGSVPLPDYTPPDKVALIVGNEVKGLEAAVLDRVDLTIEIPMLGQKESFNVVQAAAMALYYCRFLA